MITLDPIGYCLLRELVEANEARIVTDNAYTKYRDIHGVDPRPYRDEHRERWNLWQRLSLEFAGHLVLTRQEVVNTSLYRSWPVSYRMNRQSTACCIAGDAIRLYKSGYITPQEEAV